MSPWREASGRVFAAVTHLHIRQLRVVGAVRFARFRRIVAEPEGARAGLAERPAAGDNTAIWPRRRRCHTNGGRHGDRPRRQDRHVGHRRCTACGSDQPRTGQRRQGRAGHPARGGPPRRSSAGAIAADRRWSRRQIQPMRLADHRIFRNTQPPAYLGGRQPLIPKRPQPDNRLFGPLHLVVPPTVQPQDTVSLWALGSTTHCRAATKTCGKPIAYPNPLGSAR